MKGTTRGSIFGCRRWALYVPILLCTGGVPVAWAQCSQATQAEATSSDQPATAAESGHPAGGSESLSQTNREVRFATGNAITVLEDTPLQVVNDMPISSRTTKAGARLAFTVTRDVVVDGVLVIPCGAKAYGTVVEAKQAGRLAGTSNLTVQLTTLNLDGRSYQLYTPPFKVVGESKTRPTVNKMATGAAVGALAMDIRIAQVNPHLTEKVTGGERALADGVGAGLGAGVGAVIAASSPPSISLIPAEAQMEFTLASPIAVYPVDQRTAARLAQGLHKGGPVLYVRGESQ